MNDAEKNTYIADEAFMITHSGEIPEIAYHSSLYYLAQEPDGPGLELDKNDILLLQQAVVKRYQTIIRRDLAPGNRDKRVYRGLSRCAVNWQRLYKFCTVNGLECGEIRRETAQGLRNFLRQEVTDVKSGRRISSINCPQREIEHLAESVGLASVDLPEGWRDLCPVQELVDQ
ncbi:MAG: hypothetical protein ACWGN1_02360 [Desulfobulbales bacterium]